MSEPKSISGDGVDPSETENAPSSAEEIADHVVEKKEADEENTKETDAVMVDVSEEPIGTSDVVVVVPSESSPNESGDLKPEDKEPKATSDTKEEETDDSVKPESATDTVIDIGTAATNPTDISTPITATGASTGSNPLVDAKNSSEKEVNAVSLSPPKEALEVSEPTAATASDVGTQSSAMETSSSSVVMDDTMKKESPMNGGDDDKDAKREHEVDTPMEDDDADRKEATASAPTSNVVNDTATNVTDTMAEASTLPETSSGKKEEEQQNQQPPSETVEEEKVATKMDDSDASPKKKRSLDEATSTDEKHPDKGTTKNENNKSSDDNNNNNNNNNNTNSTKKRKTVSKKHMNPKVLEIRHMIQTCCQSNDLATAIEAYQKAVTEKIRVEAQSFYNLLSLCDGLERTVHIGTPKTPPRTKRAKIKALSNGGEATTTTSSATEPPMTTTPPPTISIRPVTPERRQEYAFQIKQHMDDLKLPLTETAYTALVRLLSRTRQLDAALKLVQEAEQVQQCKPKLRLYSSLLLAYCEMGQLEKALALRKRIVSSQQHQRKQQQPLVLTEKECTALLQCAIANDNASVFEGILSELAEDVLVPSKDTVAALLEWFISPHAKLRQRPPTKIEQDTMDKLKQLLEEGHVHNNPEINSVQYTKQKDGNDSGLPLPVVHQVQEPPPSMGPVVTPNGWNISSSCPIDSKTGTLQRGCLQGCSLQPVQISDRVWSEMKHLNESIVVDGQISGNQAAVFQGGKKGKLRKDFSPATRQEQWSKFCTFLKDLETKNRVPDVVLDGANIGYYQQNFSGAPKHVDYDQIDWMVRHFVNHLNQNVLLVIHQRHFAPNLMPAKFQPLVDEWERLGVLYKTPPGMNDDWFWLHAALTYKTLVVTNDEMRDHHFQMLAPRMFLRWKDRHQVHFDFGDWIKQGGEESSSKNGADGSNGSGDSHPNRTSSSTKKRSRQVQLVHPDVYSRRVQRVEDGLVVPLAKRGDTNRFLDGAHEANDDEPEEETYLCIRPEPPQSEAT